MPSRLTCIAIMAFWLATTGWLIHREVLPHFRADGPPPVVIEFADEAVRQPLPVMWQLYRNGQRLTQVKTSIKYEDDDSFSLISTVYEFEAFKTPLNLLGSIVAKSIRSVDRVTRSGRLLARISQVELVVDNQKIMIVIDGEIRDGQLVSHCHIDSPLGPFDLDLPAVAISTTGTLNPFHPMHSFPRLRPGQTWRQSTSDPLTEAVRLALETRVKSMVGTLPGLDRTGPQMLIAEVTGPSTFTWKKSLEECWIIEYRGQDYHALAWVRMTDGTVLRQEASTGGERWVLERE